MSSTFTAPIRINTRINPTNDGTIAPSNAGAAICSQQVAVAGGAAATVIIPAGSIINSIKLYANVVGAANRAVTVGGVAVGTIDTTALGVTAMAAATTAAAANKLANVGGTDNVSVVLASEAASAGTLSVEYTPRNPDGTITPYGSGYTNS